MIKMMKFVSCALAIILMSAIPSGCVESGADSDGAKVNISEYSSEPGSWEDEAATIVTLNGESATVSGSGVELVEGIITVTAEGTYVLSGSFNGQIAVDADKCKVRLVLNGVELHCENSSAIYIKDAKKLTLTLAAGTTNTVSDGSSYVFESSGEDEPNATIFSKADLIIEGEGVLNVESNYNNAIRSKDTLEILSGNLNINSVGCGISGKDYLAIKDGSFVLNCETDGIKSTNADDASLGYIQISGGSFEINAGNDAIQAETGVYIEGGDFLITTGGGAAAGASSHGGDSFGGRGGFTNESSSGENTESNKAIKCSGDLKIAGGVFSIDSQDDAIHSNGNVEISGGSLELATGDDGIHADNSLSISGGEIDITQSYEGLEGMEISITSGNVNIAASDDGINSAGGNDSSGFGGGGGMFEYDDSCNIYISGGTVLVNAAGDGIDSNGNLYISGGVTIVDGPTDNGNGALDYGGECVVTGGILLAAGSSGMSQGLSGGSTQASMNLRFQSAVNANTLIGVIDSNGEMIAAYAPKKQFSSFVFTSPELVEGDTYTISYGGSCSGSTVNGLYTDGALSDYTEAGTVTLTSVATNGEGGNPGGGNPDGGNPGGHGGR